MYPSKLLNILATFTNKEIKNCEIFVESPFFNKREDLILFYKYITKHHPNYEHHTLKAEQAFKYMYPKQVFSERKLRHLMSNLTKLLEQFLIQLALQKSEDDQQRKLLKSYEERNLRKYFDNTLNKHVKKLEEQPIRNIEYYRQQYLIKEQKAEVYNEKVTSILEQANDLDIFYIITKLRNACLIKTFERILKLDFEVEDLFLMSDIFKHIETHPEKQEVPAIFVYYLIYKLLAAPDHLQDQYFEELLQQLSIHKKQFTEVEIDNMYSYAHNHCIKRINQNKQSYRLKLFDLYQMRLQNILVIGQGSLPQWEYINIVLLSTNLKKFQFTLKFIKDYETKIEKENRKNATNLAKAFYEFSQQNFGKTMSHLHRIHINDFHFYFKTNTLMIKVYYEQKQKAPLEDSINAFRMYIKRSKSKIPPAFTKQYGRFAKYVKKFNRIEILIGKREKKRAELAIQKIIDEINADKAVADIDWLKEKINEFLLKLGMKMMSSQNDK